MKCAEQMGGHLQQLKSGILRSGSFRLTVADAPLVPSTTGGNRQKIKYPPAISKKNTKMWIKHFLERRFDELAAHIYCLFLNVKNSSPLKRTGIHVHSVVPISSATYQLWKMKKFAKRALAFPSQHHEYRIYSEKYVWRNEYSKYLLRLDHGASSLCVSVCVCVLCVYSLKLNNRFAYREEHSRTSFKRNK